MAKLRVMAAPWPLAAPATVRRNDANQPGSPEAAPRIWLRID